MVANEFSCACWLLVYLLWKNVCSNLCPFSNVVAYLLLGEFEGFFIHSGCEFSLKYVLCKYFLPDVCLSFCFDSEVQFLSLFHTFGVVQKTSLPMPKAQGFSSLCSSRSLLVSGLTLRWVIRFEFTFLFGEK